MDRRIVPSAAAVDWGILGAVLVAVITGLYGLVAGRPGQAWVFVVHGVAGVALVALVALKLARVWRRIRPGRHTRARSVSVLLAAVALAALVTGVAWVMGVDAPVPLVTLLTVHMWLGVLAALLVAVHLTYRRRPAATATRAGRRNALRYLGLGVAAALAWRAQQFVAASRRFTGSRERGSGEGNRFPVTSWVADDPVPIDIEEWVLSIQGRVDDEFDLTYEALDPRRGAHDDGDGVVDPATTERATLDCTSGWYSVHEWRGVRVGDLLASAGVGTDARWVQFRSVTGYRWSLPVDEARDALLATHVDDERLSHGHGFPARLVAPGRRGFQWVKWVDRVEVRRSRDWREVAAIHLSGLGEA